MEQAFGAEKVKLLENGIKKAEHTENEGLTSGNIDRTRLTFGYILMHHIRKTTIFPHSFECL